MPDVIEPHTQDEPIAYASRFTHEKVFALLEGEKRGMLLDAPAGQGHAAKKLKEMGFSVVALGLDVKDFKLPDVRFETADLNKDLPFEDRSFDHIICLEGIEHIENPHHLVREFQRILRAGGTLTISTPNVLCVYSRVRYFLTGYADWIHSRINLPPEKKTFHPLQQHINMIDYPELHFILNQYGFAIETIASNESSLFYPWGKWYVRIVAVPFFLLAAGVIRLFGTVIKRDITLKEYLLKNELLYGELVIVKARKSTKERS